MLYKVGVKEVHIQDIWVEADSVLEAVVFVEDEQGDSLETKTSYDGTLDSDSWNVIVEKSPRIIKKFKDS